MLQGRDRSSGVSHGLALSNLYDLGAGSPEVGQGKDDARSGKDLCELFLTSVEVCGSNINSLVCQGQSSRLGDIASQAPDAVLLGVLEKLCNNRSSLYSPS